MDLAVLLDTGDELTNIIEVLFFLFLCFGLYFLPTIIAWEKKDRWPVCAINFFLGWTLVGWVVALAWALRSDNPAHIVVNNPAPPAPRAVLCMNCGTYSPGGANFCPQCGMKWAIR